MRSDISHTNLLFFFFLYEAFILRLRFILLFQNEQWRKRNKISNVRICLEQKKKTPKQTWRIIYLHNVTIVSLKMTFNTISVCLIFLLTSFRSFIYIKNKEKTRDIITYSASCILCFKFMPNCSV